MSDVMSDVKTDERTKASVREVLGFAMGYWRNMPVRFTILVSGVLAAILIELQIPVFSAALVVAAEKIARGEASPDMAWSAMQSLVLCFAIIFLLQQGYLRVWMYVASEIMQHMVTDGF